MGDVCRLRHHAFLYISLPSLHNYDVELCTFMFQERREHEKTIELFLFLNLQSWTKVLGTVLPYSYVSIISRFPLKSVHFFRIFLQFSLPPSFTKLKLGKKFSMQASNIVCGVRGRIGPVWIGKRPRNAKVSQDFCPWLSKRSFGIRIQKKKANISRANWTRWNKNEKVWSSANSISVWRFRCCRRRKF